MTSLIRATDVDKNQIKPFMPTDLLLLVKYSFCSLANHVLTFLFQAIRSGWASKLASRKPTTSSFLPYTTYLGHYDDLEQQMTSICPSLTAVTRLSLTEHASLHCAAVERSRTTADNVLLSLLVISLLISKGTPTAKIILLEYQGGCTA